MDPIAGRNGRSTWEIDMLTVILAPGSLNHIANIVKGYAIAVGIMIAIGFVWLWWSHRQRSRSL